MMTIRAARASDAEAASAVLRRSITALCVPDHGNDAARLAHWLRNKTPDHFRSWLGDPLNTIFVASENDTILGVGGLRQGEGISLNYVDPAARFSGVSNAMILRLEDVLRQNGAVMAYLTSTHTARLFYERRGYGERHLPEKERHPFGIAMAKRL